MIIHDSFIAQPLSNFNWKVFIVEIKPKRGPDKVNHILIATLKCTPVNES